MKGTVLIDLDNRAIKGYTTKSGLKAQMQELKEALQD